MATTTPNIGLTLPVGTEKVSRQIVNQNMTKIDEKVGAVPNGQNLQAQVTSLSEHIASFVPSKTFTIPASGSKSITFEANSRAILFGNNNVNGYFMCFAFCDGSGSTGNIPIMTGSNVTITNNSNYTLSFANGTARDIKCGILVMDGGFTV